jgi:hypothetical protein
VFHIKAPDQWNSPLCRKTIMPKNEWVHLTWTFDGTDLRVYLNGVDEIGPKPFSIGPAVDAPVFIGVSHAAEGRIFHGFLDEVRVYDKALTAEEIQVVMQGGEGFPNAFGPNPADGSLYPDTWVNLSWRPGDLTVQRAHSWAARPRHLLLSVFQDSLIRMVLFPAQLTTGGLMRSMTPSRIVPGRVTSGAFRFHPRPPMHQTPLMVPRW